MTKEDRKLLLKDLSSRLMYRVKVTWDGLYPITLTPSIYVALWKEERDQNIPKVYLRPMSSMTEEEEEKFEYLKGWCNEWDLIDWLNAHHFDYRNLIEKGLAIEVIEENNPYKE